MDSDSNTGSAGSTQIQYKHIGEIQNCNTIQIQGQAGQFPSSGKKPVGRASSHPASGNNLTATAAAASASATAAAAITAAADDDDEVAILRTVNGFKCRQIEYQRKVYL